MQKITLSLDIPNKAKKSVSGSEHFFSVRNLKQNGSISRDEMMDWIEDLALVNMNVTHENIPG